MKSRIHAQQPKPSKKREEAPSRAGTGGISDLQASIGNRATSNLIARASDGNAISRKVVPATVKGVRIGKTRVYSSKGKIAGRVGKGVSLQVDWLDSPASVKTVSGSKPLIKVTSAGGIALAKGADSADLWISNRRVIPTSTGSEVTVVEDVEEDLNDGAMDTPVAPKQQDDADPEAVVPGKDDAVEPGEKLPPEPIHPPPQHSPLTLAGGQKILDDAFSGIKKFVPGKIEILNTDLFSKAYDAIYGGGKWSWAAYVVPTYGGLNGFAHNGVNYINSDSAGLHTVVHEMLHNNNSKTFAAILGSRFDEGMTELLTQEACALANEDAPTCYPGETPVVETAIAQGLPRDDIKDAYFDGTAKEKVADWIDANCTDNFATFKVNFEAKNWAAAKASLIRKA